MPTDHNTKALYHRYLEGGGEMGERTRNFDWASTVIGSPDTWPQALLTTVSIILNSKFPMFLWWGPELIQFYNDAYRPSLGRNGKHPQALGQRGEDCWTEIWPVIKPLVDQVMTTGESTWNEDQLIPIYRNGKLEDVYWTFSYSRVIDEEGKHGGVLVICTETTDKVKILNSVTDAKQELEVAQAETKNERDRLQRFFMQAPAGICILDGPDLVYELVNPLYQQLLPGRELLGKPIGEALPELKDQPIWGILQDVYRTGNTFEGRELMVPLRRTEDGPLEDIYFNFIYQARHNSLGKVDGIMVFCFEVTEMVRARKQLENARDTLTLALSAAELGTFDMDLESGALIWDKRCRELFGISHQDTITYERDFAEGLHPDDRERIIQVITDLFGKKKSSGDYDVEYRTVGADDGKVRWVRAKGRVYYNEGDKPIRFLGAVLDITEQKSDELRKNDFIGMVSHELKTPLTSLTALIQIMQGKASKNGDTFASNALERSNTQVKKMSAMINGFLNVSRLESGKIELHLQHFAINELINEMISEAELTMPTHNLTFKDCPVVVVHADRDKIGSVISNLLSNAVKYSPRGDLIEVTCNVEGDNVKLSVKDYGMGIRPDEIDHIFERYYRVQSNHRQHISGFGIGLYLSAEIVERHGGVIGVDSETGKGSTFWFTLPVDK